jgi:hypothetical protein
MAILFRGESLRRLYNGGSDSVCFACHICSMAPSRFVVKYIITERTQSHSRTLPRRLRVVVTHLATGCSFSCEGTSSFVSFGCEEL